MTMSLLQIPTPGVLLLGVCISLTFPLIFTVTYNLFFHPLRKFPGPKLWASTCLVRHFRAIKGDLDIHLRQLHEQYGEVVRFSPTELSFTNSQAWKDIYGHGRIQMPKGLFYPPDETPNISFSNDADHSRFRKAMANAFSEKALRTQELLIKQYIDEFILKLRGVAESRSSVDMVLWYNLVGFDLIGDLAFGKSFGGLRNHEYHSWVQSIFLFAKSGAVFNMCLDFPWLLKVLRTLSSGSVAKARTQQSEHADEVARERINNPEFHGRGDFMDSLLQTGKNVGLLSEAEVLSNANILLIAGAETTSTALSGTTFLLLRNPEALVKLQQEVRQAFLNEEDITFINTASKLPYLNACLEEGLRLYPPIGGGLPRLTLDDTMIANYAVPPKTLVMVHQSATNHSPTNFHRPSDFCPERWLPEASTNPSSEFYHDNRGAMQAFSVGPRNCIGRNLAYNEMRVILARVAWNFDMRIVSGQEDWMDQKAYAFWEKKPLMVDLSLRA
ncbi:Versicolorin B desaturase [Cercospora zeina]